MKKLYKVIILLSLTLIVVGCSSTKNALKAVGLGSDNSLNSISIEAISGSNLDTPVALDLLFIKDEQVTPILLGLSGPAWFNDKQGLIKRYDSEVSVVSFEVVPLSYIEKVKLPKDHKKAKNILLFANYQTTEGQYVAELSHFSRLKIRLLKSTYQLQELSQ